MKQKKKKSDYQWKLNYILVYFPLWCIINLGSWVLVDVYNLGWVLSVIIMSTISLIIMMIFFAKFYSYYIYAEDMVLE